MLRLRFFTDAVSAALIALSTAYFFTGKALHEWLGLFAVLILIFHNALNRRWWKKPLAGTFSAQKGVVFALNAALALSVVAVAVSGAMLSRHIFPFVPSGGGLFARNLHTTSAAWLFVLSAAHAGLHAPFFAGALKNLFRLKKSVPAPREKTAAKTAARLVVPALGVALAICGVFAFLRRSMGQKLTAEASFDPFAFGDALPRFLFDYGCIAALFFVIGAALRKILSR